MWARRGSWAWAETQQVLVNSELRGRVRLRVDGGFRPRGMSSSAVCWALMSSRLARRQSSLRLHHGARLSSQHLPTGIATQRAACARSFPMCRNGSWRI